MNKMKVLVVASLVALVAFTGCQNPIDPGQSGTLTVSMNDAVSRSILPGISMNPASYDLIGTGPNGASFTKAVSSGSSATMTGLAFGEWTVTATAKNSAGTAIGQGSGTVTVLSNASVSLGITVRPYDGFGTLSLNVSWPADQVQTAQIQSTLTPASGSARDLIFAVNGSAGTASYTASDAATGYHTLILKLLDNGHLAIGAVEVVRIVKDQTTSGTLTFANVNQATGTLEVNLTPDMGDPLEVSISGSAATKPANQSLSLSAAVSNYADNVTYVWYVNGDAKATGANYSFDNTWAQGYYRIDITAFSADGKRAGSASANCEVTPGGQPQLPSSGFDITGSYASSGNQKAFLALSAWNLPSTEAVIAYRIYRGSTASTINFYKDVTPTNDYKSSSYFTDLGLTNGQVYYYQVAVHSTSGLSNKTAVFQAQPNSIPSPNFKRIWGSSDADVYAVGDNGVVWHYNGTTWSYLEIGTGGDLLGIDGTSGQNIWVVGVGGLNARFNGTTWQTDYLSPYGQTMYDVYVPSQTTAWAGHSGGYFYSFNGSRWDYSSVSGPQKTGIGGSSANNIWGTDEVLGWITHWNGSSWTLDTNPLGDGVSTGRYGVVVPSDTSVTIVGKNGSIISNFGSGWMAESSPSSETLYEIAYRSGFGYYAVGANGTILHKNEGGSSWTTVASGTTQELRGVWISPLGRVWICGLNGTLFSIDA